MSEDEIEALAIKVADLVMVGLIERQKEWDQQFANEVNQMFSGYGYITKNEKELLLAELHRLTELLSHYEEKQDYEKCSVLHDKIKIIENKLSKL